MHLKSEGLTELDMCFTVPGIAGLAPLQDTGIRRAGPCTPLERCPIHHGHTPHLESTLEMTLLLEMQVSQHRGYESSSVDPLCNVVVRVRERCSPLPYHLQQVRVVAPGSQGWEN